MSRVGDLIVSALLCAPPDGSPRWILRDLARATGLSPQLTREGVQRLRHAGKIDFKDLTLSPSMRVSGEVAPPLAANPDLPPAPTLGCESDSPADAAATVSAGIDLPANPTGQDLVDAIRDHVTRHGLQLKDFLAPVVRYTPSSLLQSLSHTAKPQAKTVERVRALLEGRPLLVAPADQPQGSATNTSLKAAVIAEAEATGRNRQLARSTGGGTLRAGELEPVVNPAPAPPAQSTLVRKGTGWQDSLQSPRTALPIEQVRRFGDTLPAPSEAIRHCQSQMPDLWARCVAVAQAEGLMPGEMLLRAVSAGLDCLEEAE